MLYRVSECIEFQTIKFGHWPPKIEIIIICAFIVNYCPNQDLQDELRRKLG